MKYLIVFGTASLSAMKMSCQSAFGKKGVKTNADGVFFNMLIFLSAALLFLPYLFSAKPIVFLYGAVYAVCNE